MQDEDTQRIERTETDADHWRSRFYESERQRIAAEARAEALEDVVRIYSSARWGNA